MLRLLLACLCLSLGSMSYAVTVEQYNLPNPTNYKSYKLRVQASTRQAEVGKPVILKAILSPETSPKQIEYQFLINGAPISEPGMHKVHTFREKGTYKISVVAKLGGVYLLNSPPLVIHVIDAWIEPEAIIAPASIVVKQGEQAVFTSESEIDQHSREWLYWSVSTGHRGSGLSFNIPTENLEPGKYPIELIARDDRKRESTANALLVVVDKETNIETLMIDGENTGAINTLPSFTGELDLQLYSSHKHRLEGMPVVFWIQNAQPGAGTELQLDTGDGKISGWSRRLRYGHAYEHFGVYQTSISSKTLSGTKTSAPVTVYIWPLWFPILLMIMGLFLAGIPFFKRQQRLQKEPAYSIYYTVHEDPGHHQLIVSSEEEQPSLRVRVLKDNGKQTLELQQGKHE
ncbi:MAG: Unknown protein [uncultured Thiotrichaceae bacterium]|uniref:Uncharacterized protein n=1 Tax=uncultured Thiotrichaceae bacterium TaxID=298394 RepID=A0A6S6UJJ0_9GAMM|nr:MAG: Unknown protein [uncultured Thiotrichaceae bacterium]